MRSGSPGGKSREKLHLFGNKGCVGVGSVVDGGFDAVPIEGFVVPDGIEEAGLAAGGGAMSQRRPLVRVRTRET